MGTPVGQATRDRIVCELICIEYDVFVSILSRRAQPALEP